MILKEMQRYLNQHAARSQHTARTYRNGLRRFEEFLEECEIDLEDPVETLNLGLLRDFVPWLGRRPSSRGGSLSMRTRHNYTQGVSGFFRQIVMEGKLPDVTYGDFMATHEVVVKMTRFKEPPLEKKLPPDGVMAAVVEAAQQPPNLDGLKPRQRKRQHMAWLRNRAMLLSLYSTGMRVGELVGIKRGDLDYEDRGCWVTGKGEQERFVRFSSRAWQAIMAYLEARQDEILTGTITDRPVFCRHDRAAGDWRTLPLSTLTVEKTVTEVATDAGVLARFRLTPHSFRHYFATRFLKHTGNLALTQDALGHASPQTTRIYAKTTKAQHIAAHESLFDED